MSCPSTLWGRAMKRGLDIALSVISLVVLVIPFALIALAIKLDSRGPVLFRQVRSGQWGKTFRIWKFRTMAVGVAENGLGRHVRRDEPGVTRVGRVLRGLGVDELPQVINVLIGDMSLVGPRPTMTWQVERYDHRQRTRLAAKPGITSSAILAGRNTLSWDEKIEHDIAYISGWSIWKDLKILAVTPVYVLVLRRGVYGDDSKEDPFISDPHVQEEARGSSRHE